MSATLQKDITGQALQMVVSQKVRLSKGQNGLLKEMRRCVENKLPLSYENVVKVYYTNVAKTCYDYNFIGEGKEREKTWYQYDIMESYLAQDWHWQYHVKGRIGSWFTGAIGSLVMKNQLIVIPTIELDENS